jgi:hypothetical protein
LAFLFTAGCTQCRSGTVLLDMKLPEGTSNLELSLTLNTETKNFSRIATSTRESVEVTFNRGYVAGSSLDIYINALSGQNPIDEISRLVTLSDGCTTVFLDFLAP